MPIPNLNIVGIGKMGGNWASALSDFEKSGYIRFSAISDINPELISYVKSSYPRKKFYLDYKEMISKENPDGIVIAVPAGYHLCIVRGCADSGCGKLLVEKPFVPQRNLKEGIETLKYVKGRTDIMTGDIVFYDPVTKTLMEHKAKILGEIESVVAYRISPYPWRMDDVDVLDDLVLHDFHNFRYMTNWPNVQIIGAPIHRSLMRPKQKDYCSFRASTIDDVSFASTSAWIPGDYKMRLTYVRGNKTTAEMDYVTKKLRIGLETEGKNVVEIPVQKEDELRNELKEFVEFVGGKKNVLTPVEREMETLIQMRPILYPD